VNASAVPPAGTAPASGQESAARFDPGQRLTAARIQHASPCWLVMWGTHSRRFFAFPLFGAPPGTIVTASGPDRLLTRMRQAETATVARARMSPAPLPGTQVHINPMITNGPARSGPGAPPQLAG
jgi:hypothetical protein